MSLIGPNAKRRPGPEMAVFGVDQTLEPPPGRRAMRCVRIDGLYVFARRNMIASARPTSRPTLSGSPPAKMRGLDTEAFEAGQ